MSVVEQWRDRSRSLRGEYWRCGQCGRFSTVHRAACVQCGSAKAQVPAELPRSLMARGWSHAHLVIETMDQAAHAKPVMLLELPGAQMLPMPLASSDRKHAADLIGQSLRLVLRRMRDVAGDAPIVYGRKVAADPETRAALLKNSGNTKRENG